MINPQASTTALPKGDLLGTVFGVFDRLNIEIASFGFDEFGAQFFFGLPVAKAGEWTFGWSFTLDCRNDVCFQAADIADEMAGDMGFAFEVGQATVVEEGNIVAFGFATEVLNGGFGVGEEDYGVGVEFVKDSLGGELVFDEGFEDFGVLAEFGQG